MSKILRLREPKLGFTDTSEVRQAVEPGIWARTEVIGGYGYHPGDRFTKSYLDENMFEESNTVPISGVQAIFEWLFGVKGPINIDTLYKKTGIGAPDEDDVPSFLVPDNPDTDGTATSKDAIYQVGHLVQLFGVGVTGTAENNITVHKVGYRETEIDMDVSTPDGDLNGTMYPFRYTESELTPTEKQKYFGKRIDSETGKTAYYLKRFEAFPEIKHIWKTSDIDGNLEDDVEIEVTNDTVWDFSRDDAVQSFVEIHLRITSKDLKEFFSDKLDQPEACRFNCIALYNGRYTEDNKTADEQFGDYTNVKLFSKLNIPTEPLSLQKDLEIIYRIYGS